LVIWAVQGRAQLLAEMGIKKARDYILAEAIDLTVVVTLRRAASIGVGDRGIPRSPASRVPRHRSRANATISSERTPAARSCRRIAQPPAGRTDRFARNPLKRIGQPEEGSSGLRPQ